MKIDIHNYEAFFLDYKEGNLDAAGEKELFAFLEQYPQLKAELNSFEDITLDAEVSFSAKSSLKKAEFSDESLIAYTENLVNAEEKKEIEKLASENKAFQKELSLYKATVLSSDEEIKFPAKSKLKRGGVVIYLQSNPVVLRVAAAILLLIGLFFLVSKMTSDKGSESVQPVLANGDKKEIAVPAKDEKEIVSPEINNNNLAAVNDKKDEVANSSNGSTYIKKDVKNDPPLKSNNAPSLATNTVSTNNPIALANNPQKADSFPDKVSPNTNPLVENSKPVYKSYYNYALDTEKDEDEAAKAPVTASAPAKKTFFQKITNAARRANEFGVKNVNAEESTAKNSVSVGGLVVTETFSN